MKRLLTTRQLCDELQFSRTMLWKFQKQGMPYIRMGTKLLRYDFDDVVKWLKERSVLKDESSREYSQEA